MALLDTAPLELAYQAEDWLGSVAGPRAQAPTLREDHAARAKCRSAWEAWWNKNQAKLDLSRVDLAMLFNPVVMARDTARRWLDAYARGDLAGMKRVTRFPVNMEGQEMTEAQYDDVFKQIAVMIKTEKISFDVLRVVKFDEYFKTLMNKRAKTSFDKLRQSQVMVVYVKAKIASQPRASDGAVLVGLVQGRARIVGLGPAGADARRP